MTLPNVHGPLVYVRWVDAVEDEVDDIRAEPAKTCVRENLGWLVHNQANRLVICTEVISWPDGPRSFFRLVIDPDWVIDMHEVGK